MCRGFDQSSGQYSSTAREWILVLDLKIVSALEIEIIIDHVGSYLNETGTKNSEKEGSEVEDMSDLKRDYSTENYWDKGRLQERDAHGP